VEKLGIYMVYPMASTVVSKGAVNLNAMTVLRLCGHESLHPIPLGDIPELGASLIAQVWEVKDAKGIGERPYPKGTRTNCRTGTTKLNSSLQSGGHVQHPQPTWR
jgi:hypothetical protein